MGRQRKAIGEIVAPAFRQFLEEVIPARQATSAVAARNNIGDADSRRALLGKTSSEVRYLNRLLSESIQQPAPEKAWAAGEMAFALDPGHDWCASLLFVFAAGHLAVFAKAMATANEELLPRQRKAGLVQAARTACNPTRVTTEQDLRAQLNISGIPDTIIQMELRKLRSGAPKAARPDRDAWILRSEERAALHAAFLNPSSELPRSYAIAIETSRLATENPEIGVEMQRDIAVTSLWNAFTWA